jgi:tRNA threonylcarbamoyladenosine biosynthesis protein TsaE
MQTNSLQEFRAEAEQFARALTPREDQATVVALSGDLGAGKTTFVQAAAAALGVAEPVRSPTFIIMQIFEIPAGRFKRLIHIDAYRLKSLHELEVLGWNEIVADPENLIFIEWPEQVEGALPRDAYHITLASIGMDNRTLTIFAKKSS